MTIPTKRDRTRRRAPIKWYLIRRWFYWLAAAVIGMLVYYKVIEPEAGVVILPVVLAALNTNPPPTPDETA